MVGRDYCWRVAEGGQVSDPKQGGEFLSGKRLRIWGYDPSIAPSQDQTCLISHTFREIKAASVGGLIHFEAKGSSVLLRRTGYCERVIVPLRCRIARGINYEAIVTTVGVGPARDTRCFGHRVRYCLAVALADNTGNFVTLTPLCREFAGVLR
jgi:hypothetical protein